MGRWSWELNSRGPVLEAILLEIAVSKLNTEKLTTEKFCECASSLLDLLLFAILRDH
jgi:hypothetical protein